MCVCTACGEIRGSTQKSSTNKCEGCGPKAVRGMFIDNDMTFAPVPDELRDLSIGEELLIARVQMALPVQRLRHGGLASKGHVCFFMKKMEGIAYVLPRLREDITTVRLRIRGDEGADDAKVYRVRRKRVQEALVYLKANHEFYRDIQISDERLSMLPEDGEVVSHEAEGGGGETRDEGPAQGYSLHRTSSTLSSFMDGYHLMVWQAHVRQCRSTTRMRCRTASSTSTSATK